MTIIYREEDATLEPLLNKLVGVVGYGDLGRPAALALRDSGVNVLVSGNLQEIQAAQADGFPTEQLTGVALHAEILMLFVPDEVMTPIYMSTIAPNLRRGTTLVFGSAYNLAYGFIEPPPFVDVGLIAPRTVGGMIRPRFSTDEAFFSFVAVAQDASGHSWEMILALALALGSLRDGAMEVSVEQEAQINAFIQQVIVPILYNTMVMAGQVLLKAGYPPEAVLSDLYLSGKAHDFLRQAARGGLLPTLERMSIGGQYGAVSRFSRFEDGKLERLMEITLDEIRSGDFAQEWSREFADGLPRLQALLKQHKSRDLWDFEAQTLDLLEQDE